MDRPVRLGDIMRPEHNSFGVIRLSMALAVLVSHSYYFVTGQNAAEPLVGWTGHSLGEHAVQVFFFLSGILVTESLLRSRGVVDFATSRVLRIFPGLIVCVVLTALLLGPLVSARSVSGYFSDTGVAVYVMKTVLLISGAAPLPGVFETLPAPHLFNMSLWTLKYEVICYIGLALLGLTRWLRSAQARYVVAAVGAIALVALLPNPANSDTYTLGEHTRYFALYFGAGTIAALLKDHILISLRVTASLFALFLATLGTAWVEVGTVLFIGSATLLVATWTFGPLRGWTNAYDLSFGVYIYAAPIQQALVQVYPGLDPLGLSIVALVPVVILACGSWMLVEKPAMRVRRQVGIGVETAGAELWRQLSRAWPGRVPESARAVARRRSVADLSTKR